MGNTRSELTQKEAVDDDPWWCNGRSLTNFSQISKMENEIGAPNESASSNESTDELSTLHQKRLKIIAEKKKEMDDLRQELQDQKIENAKLKSVLLENGLNLATASIATQTDFYQRPVDVGLQTETFEVPGSVPSQTEIETLRQKNTQLQKNLAELQKELQDVNSELVAFENERREYKTHVVALKDIIAVSKQLLLMREGQIKELSQKVAEIEASLSERETQVLSDGLREEYERQLRNIKQLRALYEERQKADGIEKESLKSQLEDAKNSLKAEETKNTELEERVKELEGENWTKYDTISNLESQLGLSKAECRELQAELGVINQLFSQILVGFNNSQPVDLDGMIQVLQENHDLLTDIVINEESAQASTLPKVLLDLVKQVNEKSKTSQDDSTLPTINEESESQTSSVQQNSLNSASEIVQNLPKVWKVLTELLSHQSGRDLDVLDQADDQNPCYKSVQTPSGPTLVLSVSKTFIRLKDLIVEKKSLEKETLRLKQLNTHLETRLQDQEKRLGVVSDELSKTWHVVGKMQKQHQQLHTQEKILRYELAQKRKLLNELKEELEYCREKWLQAREKNFNTEEQWKQLRIEFASRKNDVSEDFNNSVESGYSDERESSTDEELENDFRSKPKPEVEGKILEVIQDEIANIESAVTEETSSVEQRNEKKEEETGEEEEEEACGGTGVVHSVQETLKTDLIQNDETDRKKDIDDIYKKLEQDILQTIKKTQNEASTSGQPKRTTEEILAAREERLKRLEEESVQLVSQTARTSTRSVEISNKLDELHQHYGPKPPEVADEPATQEPGPSSSKTTTTEEFLARREERLQEMEKQAQQLVGKVLKNSFKSVQMSKKLNKLHERYGESSDSSEEEAPNESLSEESPNQDAQEVPAEESPDENEVSTSSSNVDRDSTNSNNE